MKSAKFIYAAGSECSDLFFASGLLTPDPYIWFENQEERAVILSALEYGRGLKECREGVAVYPLEEFFDKEVWEGIHLTNEYAYKSWVYIKADQ